MTTLLEVDSRKRVSLGQAAGLADRYLMDQDQDGVITLTPAVVLSAIELELIRNRPDILEAVERSRADVDAGRIDGTERPVRNRRPA